MTDEQQAIENGVKIKRFFTVLSILLFDLASIGILGLAFLLN
jgi:hypothetical protein